MKFSANFVFEGQFLSSVWASCKVGLPDTKQKQKQIRMTADKINKVK
jgi:hypothetical protein